MLEQMRVKQRCRRRCKAMCDAQAAILTTSPRSRAALSPADVSVVCSSGSRSLLLLQPDSECSC